ncbi:hypothetical protein LCGC14_1715660, partial [marine sediment metagenome]
KRITGGRMIEPYYDFIQEKVHTGSKSGFEPLFVPDWLYPFQRDIVNWSIEKGRSGIFADTGLGKTPMQLVWAQNIVEKTNKSVLILAPLAVSGQTVREANKFGLEVYRNRDGKILNKKTIFITNYERLHYFNPNDFAGVVCDESSILKNFKGSIKANVTQFMRKMPYRLLATATASPNDYIELGTSSEALGYMGFVDMLSKFFKNDQNTSSWGGGGRGRYGQPKWRFKGHAQEHFWRWVISWARAIRKPSDMGHSDEGYILPPMIEREHVIKAKNPRLGELFDNPALTFHEQRVERRITIQDRCELAAELLTHNQPCVAWAHLNDEGDLLEKLIPGAKQVKGSQTEEVKEEILRAFSDGEIRALVTKPKITGFGLNWQHAHHMTFFPSHSFEQYYQGVRRMYRFGQKKSVTVDIVTSEGERGVMANLKRKVDQANIMFTELVRFMQNELKIERKDDHTKNMEVPKWV